MSNIFQIPTAHVLSAGIFTVTTPWCCEPHHHPSWELLYYTEGSGRIDTPEKTVYPRRYELVIYPPDLPHVEMSHDCDVESWYCVGVQVKATPPVGSHRVLTDRSGELGWLMERIVKETAGRKTSPLGNAYLHVLLHVIERDWEQGVAVLHDPVEVVIHYLHTHYHHAVTLESLADVAQLSVSRLAHSFRERMAVSPMRYLRRLRIEKAKMMLQISQQPISEIALCVGFSDIFHFSRTFKQVVGYAPTAYRDSVRSGESSPTRQ